MKGLVTFCFTLSRRDALLQRFIEVESERKMVYRDYESSQNAYNQHYQNELEAAIEVQGRLRSKLSQATQEVIHCSIRITITTIFKSVNSAWLG